MIFVSGVIYHEELTPTFGALSSDTLVRVLQDGRPSSRLLYAHLLAKYRNLHCVPLLGIFADCVVDDENRVFQVRTVTKHGVILLPSKNIGVGREYDAEAYRAALKPLTGFILIDVTDMPCIVYGVVFKDILPFKAKFSRRDALTLLKLGV
jgi:hypothetical protein